MVSPRPIVRPVIGDWPVDGLLDDLPTRPPQATEKLRKIVDFYLHSMVFHKDRLGRPVRFCRAGRLLALHCHTVIPSLWLQRCSATEGHSAGLVDRATRRHED